MSTVAFTGRLILFCALLALFSACGKNTQKENDEKPVAQTDQQEKVDNNIASTVEVIPEQDPNGIFWGLRDTLSGKLVMDYTYQKIWDFREGFAIVMQSGKFGLISRRGKQIIEPAFEFPRAQLECGVIVFDNILFDTTGKALMPMIPGLTGVLPCERRITCGDQYQHVMKDFNGDTILEFKMGNAHLIPEGFCVASKADDAGEKLYGLYDVNGRQILPHVFEYIAPFYCERAVVTKKGGQHGVIDQTGKELFYLDHVSIERFYNDYAVIKKYENGHTTVGVIDKNGREVVPAIYEAAENGYHYFNEGLASMVQDGKYGFVDTTGTVVIPFKYQRVEQFKNGIAKIFANGLVGYINKKGEEIIQPDFKPMEERNLRRYQSKYIIGEKDSEQHVFDYLGKEITVLHYQSIGEIDKNGKCFMVRMNSKFGILDSAFRVQIPIEYESFEAIFGDKLAVQKNGKIGFIDWHGKVFSPFVYDWIESFQDFYMNSYESGAAKVGVNGKIGIVNGYGKLVVPAIYDEIEKFSDGLVVVKRNKKYGFVNSKGKEVIPPKYDRASSFDGYAEVTFKGETFLIDHTGERVNDD